MGYKTLKTIGEVEKSKSKKLAVSISRFTGEDRTVDFVSVQELEYNKDKERFEYSKGGWTINVERWAGFMKLMRAVDDYLNGVVGSGEQEQEPELETKRPGFMGE